MAEPKTRKNDASVTGFLDAVKDPRRQKDARALLTLMKRATGETPKMWGTAIVGFGEVLYRYPNGKTNDWMAMGFSPRAQSLTLYFLAGFASHAPLLAKLGKHTIGGSCLHVPHLAEVDSGVLEELVRRGIAEVKTRHPPATRAASAKPAKKVIATVAAKKKTR